MRSSPTDNVSSSGSEAESSGHWNGIRIVGGGDHLRPMSDSVSVRGSGGEVVADGGDVLPENTHRDREYLAKPDLAVPPYDRRRETGCFAVVWLVDGEVMFSSRCRDFGHAMRMTRQHKRAPTWVVHGLERELDTAELCLSYRSMDWLNSSSMDIAVRRVIDVVATSNLPSPSHYVQPAKARGR